MMKDEVEMSWHFTIYKMKVHDHAWSGINIKMGLKFNEIKWKYDNAWG